MTQTFHKLALVLSGASLLTSFVPATSACDRGPRLGFRPVYALPYQQRVYARPQVAYPQPMPQMGVVPGQTAPVGVTIQPGQPGQPLLPGQAADAAALGALGGVASGQPTGQPAVGGQFSAAGGQFPSSQYAAGQYGNAQSSGGQYAGRQLPAGSPNQFASGQFAPPGQGAAAQGGSVAANPQLRTAQPQVAAPGNVAASRAGGFGGSDAAQPGGQNLAANPALRTSAPAANPSPAAPLPSTGGAPTAQPSSGAAPSAAARSAEALALEALAGLGGAEQAAPAPAAPQAAAPQAAPPAEQPAASGDSLPQAPKNAGLQGQFTAAVGNGATIRLSLGGDGSFVWVATKEGKSSDFQGTFSINGGSLTLHRASDNQKLEGTITLTENGFSIRFAGQGGQNGQSAQQASSLNFVRA